VLTHISELQRRYLRRSNLLADQRVHLARVPSERLVESQVDRVLEARQVCRGQDVRMRPADGRQQRDLRALVEGIRLVAAQQRERPPAG
jgi:hypothetical protein